MHEQHVKGRYALESDIDAYLKIRFPHEKYEVKVSESRV